MVIKNIKELDNVLENLSPEYNNRMYLKRIRFEVDLLFDKSNEIEVFISDDKKEITFVGKNNIVHSDPIPRNEMASLDFTISGRGELEVTKSYGELYEATSYYRGRNDRPSYNVSAVLDTTYQHSIYDQNGIEKSYSNYGKYNWGLTGVDYRNSEEFRRQLLALGWHKPRSWSYEGPELPHYSSDAMVSGTIRNSVHPGIATIYSYEVKGYPGTITNRSTYLAQIHGEYPERLRVDEWGKFAKFENGNWVVYDPYHVYEGKTIEEIMEDIVINYENVLQTSNTRRYDLEEYNALEQMVSDSIKTVEEEKLRRR